MCFKIRRACLRFALICCRAASRSWTLSPGAESVGGGSIEPSAPAPWGSAPIAASRPRLRHGTLDSRRNPKIRGLDLSRRLLSRGELPPERRGSPRISRHGGSYHVSSYCVSSHYANRASSLTVADGGYREIPLSAWRTFASLNRCIRSVASQHVMSYPILSYLRLACSGEPAGRRSRAWRAGWGLQRSWAGASRRGAVQAFGVRSAEPFGRGLGARGAEGLAAGSRKLERRNLSAKGLGSKSGCL